MSEHGLTLLALRCPACGAGLEAESEDVVFYCAACRNGYRASDTEPVLEAVEVAFLAAPTVAVAEYRPFWRLDATVDMLDRQAGRSSEGAFEDDRGLGAFLRKFFAGTTPPEAGPGRQAVRFLIPAYRTPLGNARALALGLSSFAKEPEQRLGERLTGASLPVEDARKFAEFLFLLQQAQASGVLVGLRYTLDFTGASVLIGVPFTRRTDGSLVDARIGLAV